MLLRLLLIGIFFIATTLDAMHFVSVGFGDRPGKEFEEAIVEAERAQLDRHDLLVKIKGMDSMKAIMSRSDASLDDIKYALGENFIFVATYNSNILTIWNALSKGDTPDGVVEKMFLKHLRDLLF